jgi:hypothetical protein
MLDVRERNAYKILLNKDECEGLVEKRRTDEKIIAQDRQRMYNITLGNVCTTTVGVQKQ